MTDMWESVAPGWRHHAEFIDRHLAAPTEALLDAVGVASGTVVLEVACGPGGVGLAAAARGAEVTFSDQAPGMVAVAADRAGVAATMVCDQCAIDVPDGSFDAVVSRHGLMFAEPPAAAVREAVRVLRPGGRYGAMVWAARADNPWLGLIFDAVGEQFGVPFPPAHVPGPFALDDPDRLAAALTEGGLTEVEVQRMESPLHADDLEDWWERTVAVAGPLAMALEGMEPDVRAAIHDRALAKGEPVFDGDSMPAAVLVASGVRAV